MPRPSGAVYGYLPFREVRILPGRAFCSIGNSTFTLYNTIFPIEQKTPEVHHFRGHPSYDKTISAELILWINTRLYVYQS